MRTMLPMMIRPHLSSRSLLLTLIIVLSGCAIKPPPTPITMPKSTRSGLNIIASPHDLRDMKWWEKMHDPRLNQLITESLANNNQLHTAEANIVQAQATLQQARFAWLPTLSASANGFVGGGWDSHFSPQGALAESPLFSRTGGIHFRGYYSGFVPSYSLNILANINNNKLAQASLDMQRATYLSTRLSIISQVSGAYFMLLGQKEQLREQTKLLADLKNMLQLERGRYQAGASDLSTVASLEQQIADNQASLSSIENSIAQVENALQVLLNRNPGPIATGKRINKLSIRGLIPANLPSAVLKNRPDIIMARDNLRISAATVGLAYANYFPTISLTNMVGGASIDLSHLLKLSTGLWVTQAAASMPILNGVYYEQIKAKQAGYKAAYFNYIQTIRTAFADVDNSLTNQQKMNAIYASRLKALRASKKAYAIALARYKAGAKDYRDVENAQLNVDYARLDLNQAKMQQLDSIVEVYQALAGGYGACD